MSLFEKSMLVCVENNISLIKLMHIDKYRDTYNKIEINYRCQKYVSNRLSLEKAKKKELPYYEYTEEDVTGFFETFRNYSIEEKNYLLTFMASALSKNTIDRYN